MADFGLLRSCAAAGARRRRVPPPPSPADHTDRPILNRRSRLDPDPGNPEPSDLDPMDQIQTYPFALLFLLKRPPVSFKSTRNPQPFKINYSLVQILARSPLSFLEFEPAVQHLTFCELDPGVNI